MIGGKIRRSMNRVNNYETEQGDWTFASSEPVDGRNAYMARQQGMIYIGNNIYIYGGDVLDTRTDEQGKNHAILKKPNYVYEINPDDFSPVVSLKTDKEGKPFFDFSEEWVCDKDIDINDRTQVLGEPRVITDVTELLSNYQVISDTNKYSREDKPIGIEIIEHRNWQERISILMEHIQSGELRYINEECGINSVPKEISISWQAVTKFAKQLGVRLEKQDSQDNVNRLVCKEQKREEKSNDKN